MSKSGKTSTVVHFRNIPLLIALVLAVLLQVPLCLAQNVSFVPLKASGIYDLGENAGWTIRPGQGGGMGPGGGGAGTKYTYTLKKNNLDTIKSGEIDLSAGEVSITTALNEPAMVYLELKPVTAPGAQPAAPRMFGFGPPRPLVAGAAIAPTQLQPSAPRPADFDAFWQEKIAQLKQIPENPVLTPADVGNANIEYATIQMDHLNGKHVYGQIAKPKKEGKFPALVIYQWASPPYPLQKSWITGYAGNGWLVLNVEPHDVKPDQPQAYYDALPQEIKNYQSIGNNDRDKSYFLQMYLADYRAVDYIAGRPDWDGKTLVVMGTSMGGQQSLCVAGLNPKVTHVIVNEPAGCDTNGQLHGRQAGYPNFPSNDPKIMETALYFDAVNFAPNIKATSLVAMGFVDTTAPPAGIWTAFNQIKGPKEAAPMIDSPHNNSATPAQQQPYTKRSAEWLSALVKGEAVQPRDLKAVEAANAAPQFDDYRNMLSQLGVKAVRPGPNPNDQSTFDEAKANPYKDSMPDVLKMKDGTRVTRAEQWPKRRAEIAEDFEREVYGRIPADVPAVTWEVTEVTQGESGGIPTITKNLVGHVDNSAYPYITVEIQASFTVPAGAKEKVPTMIEFGGLFGPRRPGAASMPAFFRPQPGIPWTQQAIAHGWGYGYINPGSIQPDSNQLTSGIIGLTNKGQPRKPDQWGALRAWQWGVSRLMDYFEAHPDSMVDPTKVGIEGLSRYGKAAIVTQAFDPRIAVGLIGSSGEGGVKLHRHIFGEAVENLAGGEYYWMAGNFIKYGASDPAMTAADIPVDSHELIALCAPRPCFISYGVVEKGDAKWVDAHGSFMAGVLASPVYELLGKKGFGTPGDYLTDPMPPVLTLIGGELAWRQHEGGHDVTPNWPSFFQWVGQYIQAPALPATRVPTGASKAAPRTDANSQLAHKQLLEKAAKGGIDLYFLGDSITRRWGCTDTAWAPMMENWKQNFFGWNAGNFGWGADLIQNVIWRVENGELDNVNPKVIVILAGTNNVGNQPGDEAKVEDITQGLKTLVYACQRKAPRAAIIVTGVFPRNDPKDNLAAIPTINRINENLRAFADGRSVRYLNVNDKLADADGKLFEGMTVDNLHPSAKGYQVWADGLKPILTELLGTPAATDHAPPATGDPSAAPSKQS